MKNTGAEDGEPTCAEEDAENIGGGRRQETGMFTVCGKKKILGKRDKQHSISRKREYAKDAKEIPGWGLLRSKKKSEQAKKRQETRRQCFKVTEHR